MFPVQLTTSRMGNQTRLILTLAIFVTINTRLVHFTCGRTSAFDLRTSELTQRAVYSINIAGTGVFISCRGLQMLSTDVDRQSK